MIKLMPVQKCVSISNKNGSLAGNLKLIFTQIILGTSLKNVMKVSSPEFYIVLSSKIFKAELKEFEAILC